MSRAESTGAGSCETHSGRVRNTGDSGVQTSFLLPFARLGCFPAFMAANTRYWVKPLFGDPKVGRPGECHADIIGRFNIIVVDTQGKCYPGTSTPDMDTKSGDYGTNHNLSNVTQAAAWAASPGLAAYELHQKATGGSQPSRMPVDAAFEAGRKHKKNRVGKTGHGYKKKKRK